MNYPEFQKLAKERQVHPAYFFCGAEDYLMDQCLAGLEKAAFADAASREFNYDLFYGGQTDAGKILDTANAYPMFAELRMVVVKDVQKLAPSGLDALAAFLEKPPATTRLVLTCEKFNGRNKSFARIKAKTCFVEFKPLYDNQVAAWIKQEMKRRGIEMSYDASLLIHAHVGNSLRALANEMDKIMLNLDGRNRVDEADVQRVVGLSKKFSVFNLNDAIGGRDLNKAFLILTKMLESGESHTAILAMIGRHFTSLLKVKGCVSQRKKPNEIAAIAGIPPYYVAKTQEMAKNFSLSQMDDAFAALLDTDLALKTSQQPPQIALQTLLVRILR